MDDICDDCGVWSRHPCSRYKGSNRFDGCYNLSREQQLLALAAEGDTNAQEMLELLRENEKLRERGNI